MKPAYLVLDLDQAFLSIDDISFVRALDDTEHTDRGKERFNTLVQFRGGGVLYLEMAFVDFLESFIDAKNAGKS